MTQRYFVRLGVFPVKTPMRNGITSIKTPLNLKYNSFIYVNLRTLNSLAVTPRSSSSQEKMEDDLRITLPESGTDESLINQVSTDAPTLQQMQDAINMVESNLNQITLEARGIKRSQNDL